MNYEVKRDRILLIT